MSFAGIEVPKGQPGVLEQTAGEFGAIAASLSGVAGELRGMPGSLTWSGPASVSYAGSCLTNSSGIDTAVTAFGQAEQAARTYATTLRDAKERAREAIRDARDAQQRIDAAERAIEDARNRQTAARNAVAFASKQIALSAVAATPAPEFEAARAQAERDAAVAADDEGRARRALERAQDDLARAKRRGRRAMDDARDAGQAAAAAFGAAAASSPAYAAAGAPGAGAPGGGSWFNTTNEGSKTFDEDAFMAQLWFAHPRNDTVGRYKWFGDQALNFGLEPAGAGLTTLGHNLRGKAITPMTELRLSYTRAFQVAPDGSTRLVTGLQASTRAVDVIDYGKWMSSGKYLKAGKALPLVGAPLSIGGAAWDQWRDDAKHPDLTTTDRVGRAAGVGTYVGGAAIAGAAVGSVIPGLGTAAGFVVGAGIGLAAGAVASSITPVKEAFADAGQWTANAAVDAADWTGDRIDDIGDTLGSVKDKLPDLNPF